MKKKIMFVFFAAAMIGAAAPAYAESTQGVQQEITENKENLEKNLEEVLKLEDYTKILEDLSSGETSKEIGDALEFLKKYIPELENYNSGNIGNISQEELGEITE